MTSDDEEAIRKQIVEAEETSKQEAERWEVDNPPIQEDAQEDKIETESRVEEDVKTDTVGDSADKPEPSASEGPPATNGDLNGHSNANHSKKAETAESTDHHGEEMVEGEEDTVIY